MKIYIFNLTLLQGSNKLLQLSKPFFVDAQVIKCIIRNRLLSLHNYRIRLYAHLENLKVIYHSLYSVNKFVTNKSKLPQDGAQVFPYVG